MRPFMLFSFLFALGCTPQNNQNSSPTGGNDGPFGGLIEDLGGTFEATEDIGGTFEATEAPSERTFQGACTDDFSIAEIEDTLKIVEDFEKSAHEMVACGQLTFVLIATLIDVVVGLATDPGSSKLPDTFTYDSETKSYTARANTFGQTTMRVQFYDSAVTENAPEDALIQHDLFRADSYLVRASAKLNFRTQKIEVKYQKPGPLVALLGFGDNPPNPLKLGLDDADTLGVGVQGLKFRMTVEFDDEREYGSVITYTVSSPLAIVKSALDSALLDTELLSASGARKSLEQTLDVTRWTLQYDDSIGKLNGEVDFSVEGKHFPFNGLFTYEKSGWPEIMLSCP